MSLSKHGGKRKKAGRKTEDGAKGVSPYKVSLDGTTVKKAKDLGDGSLSLGIRRKFKDG